MILLGGCEGDVAQLSASLMSAKGDGGWVGCAGVRTFGWDGVFFFFRRNLLDSKV
jgi:hypothetical protein